MCAFVKPIAELFGFHAWHRCGRVEYETGDCELPVVQGISRSVSQQHRSSPRPARRSGPTRVYRIPRTRLTAGGNGRHRCAQTPAAPPAADQTIGTRPHHLPARSAVCLSPHIRCHRCYYH